MTSVGSPSEREVGKCSLLIQHIPLPTHKKIKKEKKRNIHTHLYGYTSKEKIQEWTLDRQIEISATDIRETWNTIIQFNLTQPCAMIFLPIYNMIPRLPYFISGSTSLPLTWITGTLVLHCKFSLLSSFILSLTVLLNFLGHWRNRAFFFKFYHSIRNHLYQLALAA